MVSQNIATGKVLTCNINYRIKMEEKISFWKRYFSFHFFFKLLGNFIVANAIGVIFIGVYDMFHTWYNIFTIGIGTQDHAGVDILESIDIMLIGIVFLVFGVSIRLMIKKQVVNLKHESVNEIFDIKGFLEQKAFLWQAFATTLLFIFITQIFKAETIDWVFLVIPISVLFISASLFFTKISH